jgi:hypothetical protein
MVARLKLKTSKSMKTSTRWTKKKKTLSKRSIMTKMATSPGMLSHQVVTLTQMKKRRNLLGGNTMTSHLRRRWTLRKPRKTTETRPSI